MNKNLFLIITFFSGSIFCALNGSYTDKQQALARKYLQMHKDMGDSLVRECEIDLSFLKPEDQGRENSGFGTDDSSKGFDLASRHPLTEFDDERDNNPSLLAKTFENEALGLRVPIREATTDLVKYTGQAFVACASAYVPGGSFLQSYAAPVMKAVAFAAQKYSTQPTPAVALPVRPASDATVPK
jgi:hypothetical protein